jgi:hypothetical protein
MPRPKAATGAKTQEWFIKEVGKGCAVGETPGRVSRQSPPDTSEKHLLIYKIAAVMFEDYLSRALAHIRKDRKSAGSFLEAHAELFVKFGFGDHWQMARTMNTNRLQAMKTDSYIGTSSRPHTSQALSPELLPPTSGPSTPGSSTAGSVHVDVWLAEVPSQFNHEGGLCKIADVRSHDSASPDKPVEPIAIARDHDETGKHPQRKSFPRAAKVAAESRGGTTRRLNTAKPHSIEAATSPQRTNGRKRRRTAEVIGNKRTKLYSG